MTQKVFLVKWKKRKKEEKTEEEMAEVVRAEQSSMEKNRQEEL